MALNKFMHPRNPYKDKKPDFKALASKYEEFCKHTTQDSKEHVHLDFKKPECMRALSWALLKEDFGLDIEMPLNRLIPAIPLRLNYILWIEDLLAEKRDGIKGIDIGTGASCVYPLLAAKKNSWRFLATEADDFNTEYAKRNVARNGLQDTVQVLQVSPDTKLCGAVDAGDSYDFCMCNPPFFGSNLEAWGMLTSRSEERPEPKSVSTAAPQESIVTGGEVAFVRQIILDSLQLRGRVRIYTTMLGKKSSLAPLKAELRKHGICRFGSTELCQGRTMRWALGWTFDEHVVFKPPISKLCRQKTRPPLVIKLPSLCGALDTATGVSRVWRVSDKVIQLLNQLQMTHEVTGPTATSRKWQVSARQNTWSHQRRKRRQLAQLTGREKLTKTDGQSDAVTITEDRLGQDAIVSSSFRTHNGHGDVTTPDPKFGDPSGDLVTEVTGNGDMSTGRVNGGDVGHQEATDDVGVIREGGEKSGDSKGVGNIVGDGKSVGHMEGGEKDGNSQGVSGIEGGGDGKSVGYTEGGEKDGNSKGVSHIEGGGDGKSVGYMEGGEKDGNSKGVSGIEGGGDGKSVGYTEGDEKDGNSKGVIHIEGGGDGKSVGYTEGGEKDGNSKGVSGIEGGGDGKSVGYMEGGEKDGNSKGVSRIEGGGDWKGMGYNKGSKNDGNSKGVGHKKQGEECDYLLKFSLTVTQEKDSVVLQFSWQDGLSYDLLHQVVQFFRNRLQ